MDDLVQFLRDRLDEDERIARAAGGDDWRRQDHPSDTVAVYDSKSEPVVYAEGSPTEEQQVHVARHDPARVLAEVKAKRENLADLKAVEEAMDRAARDRDTVGYNAARAEWTVLKRIVLRDLSAYAGHPDYRNEWRP